jgi:hypothetical protein
MPHGAISACYCHTRQPVAQWRRMAVPRLKVITPKMFKRALKSERRSKPIVPAPVAWPPPLKPPAKRKTR